MIDIQLSKNINAQSLRQRDANKSSDVESTVAEILLSVKKSGDSALQECSERFDGVRIQSFALDSREIETAKEKISSELLATMHKAAENIRVYHEKQQKQGYCIAEKPGVILGQRVLPLDKVGLYVPGGTAAYPSTVLMNAIPAKIAGVGELVLVTPPGKNGEVPPAILAAAHIAGVDTVFRVGGAQAIAALAYGTQSIPKVDKIVGPGNIYVAEAKRQVFGIVDIDMIAGPSEILVIADDTANPAFVAADLLSQAEHDKLAASILLTTSEALAQAVRKELQTQLEKLPRKEIAEASLKDNGRIVITQTLREAAAISNEIAPEHLELCVKDPLAFLGEIRHAGSIFLGNYAPEALGDYLAGTNHTLPTNGAARFSSPLSVDEFIKKSSYIYYSREALQAVEEDIGRFARAETLEAHARSAEIRFERN